MKKNSFNEILKCMEEIHDQKNHDYGDSFTKSINEFGEISAMIRISDKINRLKVLLKHKAKVKDESINDTIIDCANYLVMWLDYRKNK